MRDACKAMKDCGFTQPHYFYKDDIRGEEYGHWRGQKVVLANNEGEKREMVMLEKIDGEQGDEGSIRFTIYIDPFDLADWAEDYT